MGAGHEDAVIVTGQSEEEGFEPLRERVGQGPHGCSGLQAWGQTAEELGAQQLGKHDEVRVVVIAHIHPGFYLICEGFEISHGA